MPQILPDDEIVKGINSLNSKQRKAFNAVHTKAKDEILNFKFIKTKSLIILKNFLRYQQIYGQIVMQDWEKYLR